MDRVESGERQICIRDSLSRSYKEQSSKPGSRPWRRSKGKRNKKDEKHNDHHDDIQLPKDIPTPSLSTDKIVLLSVNAEVSMYFPTITYYLNLPFINIS